MTKIKLKKSELADVRLQILAKQNWKCAICSKVLRGRTLSDACLDHCHDEGHIRGVLCRNCNRGDGKVRTITKMCKRSGGELEWLSALLQYRFVHKVPQTMYIHPTHLTEDEKRLKRNKKARLKRKKAKEKSYEE